VGYLVLDHTGGQGIDGRAGFKQEFDTETCNHCGAIIALLARPTGPPLHLSSIDVGRASLDAKDLPEKYVGKRQCCKCKQNICRRCGERQPECVTLTEQLDSLRAFADRLARG
jgi:hypothetical protein